MKKISIAILGMAFLFSACKKKDAECSLSSASFIGSYKITAVKYKASASIPEQDVTSNPLFYDVDACEKDDLCEFAANSVFNYKDVGTSCSPNANYSSTWSLSGTTLTFDGDSFPVSQFTCSGFQISSTDNFVTGDKFTIYFTNQ